MFLGPPADDAFRSAVEADVEEFGVEALRQRLQQVDPLAATNPPWRRASD